MTTVHVLDSYHVNWNQKRTRLILNPAEIGLNWALGEASLAYTTCKTRWSTSSAGELPILIDESGLICSVAALEHISALQSIHPEVGDRCKEVYRLLKKVVDLIVLGHDLFYANVTLPTMWNSCNLPLVECAPLVKRREQILLEVKRRPVGIAITELLQEVTAALNAMGLNDVASIDAMPLYLRSIVVGYGSLVALGVRFLRHCEPSLRSLHMNDRLLSVLLDYAASSSKLDESLSLMDEISQQVLIHGSLFNTLPWWKLLGFGLFRPIAGLVKNEPSEDPVAAGAEAVSLSKNRAGNLGFVIFSAVAVGWYLHRVAS